MIINNISVSDFRRYLELKRGLGESTVRKYMALLDIVKEIAGESEYCEDAILHVYEEKKKEGAKNSTLNNYRKLFKLVDKYTKIDATSDLQNLPTEPVDFDILSLQEIYDIITTDTGDREYEDHYRVLYQLLSETGLRIDEALALTYDKVYADSITIRSFKTKRYDTVLVTDDVIEAINGLHQIEDRVFPFTQQGVNKDLIRRCKFLKINKKVTTKTFRRTYGTLGVDENLSLYAIMEKLRHTNLNSMIPYIRKSKERQRELLMLHPITMERLSGEKFFTALIKKAKKLEEYNDKKGVSVSCVKETDDEYVVRIKKV